MGKNAQRGIISSLSFLILVLALFGAGIGVAAAADPIVSITPSQSNVCVGDDFDVYIAVNPNGNTLQMTQVDLTFDSSLVSLTHADGGMFGTFIAGTESGNTVIDITGVDSGVSTTGNLAVLHMHANSAGTFTLDLSGATAGTATETLTPSVNDGTVTIDVDVTTNPIVSITPSQSNVCVGDDFDVYIAVNPNGNTLQMTQVDLTFDSSLVSLTHADGGMFGTFIAGTESGNTVIDITGVDSGVSTTGNLAVLHMHANSAGTFTLDLSGATAGTATETLTPSVNDGTVTIDVDVTTNPIVSITPSQSNVCVGDDFDVYIAVNPNGNTLQMTQVDLTFDSSLVSLTHADGGMFGTFIAGTESGNTVIDITGVDSGVSTTGNLAVLHMHANSAGTFTLDLSGATAGTATETLTPSVNDGTVTVTTNSPPTVTVTSPVSGTVSGTIGVTATATDTDGTVTQVAFYLMPAGTLIGTDTNAAGGWSAPLDTNIAADGIGYQIKAVATDNEGATGENTGSVFAIDNSCPCDFCMPLEAGLNLVSVPRCVEVGGSSMASAVFNLSGIETCDSWDGCAGEWSTLPPTQMQVVPDRAYFVYKVNAETLCLNETSYLGTQTLCADTWAMVGFPSRDPMTVAEFRTASSLGDDFTTVWLWNNGGWYPTENMVPYRGYVLWMTGNGTLPGMITK